MNINEKTYIQFQQMVQSYPQADADLILAENFMEFIELLEPYASEGEDMNKLTMYMAGQDPTIYEVFMSCILNLGLRANGVDSCY